MVQQVYSQNDMVYPRLEQIDVAYIEGHYTHNDGRVHHIGQIFWNTTSRTMKLGT